MHHAANTGDTFSASLGWHTDECPLASSSLSQHFGKMARGLDVNGHMPILDVLDALQECDVECNLEHYHSSYGNDGDVAINQKFCLYDNLGTLTIG